MRTAGTAWSDHADYTAWSDQPVRASQPGSTDSTDSAEPSAARHTHTHTHLTPLPWLASLVNQTRQTRQTCSTVRDSGNFAERRWSCDNAKHRAT